MLQKSVLLDGFERVSRTSNEAYEAVTSDIKRLRADLGHSLDHDEFQEKAQSMRKRALDGRTEDVLDEYASVVSRYLNGMRDPFGDGLATPFTPVRTRPLVEAMAQSKGASEVNVNAVDQRVQQVWASYFPIQFQLTTPPPGSVQKTSSVGAPTPIASFGPVLRGAKTYEEAMRHLARILHTAASQISVTVQHVVSTPSGPAPGPPIQASVQ